MKPEKFIKEMKKIYKETKVALRKSFILNNTLSFTLYSTTLFLFLSVYLFISSYERFGKADKE